MKTVIVISLLVASAFAYPQSKPFRRGTQGRSYGGSRPVPVEPAPGGCPDKQPVPAIDPTYGEGGAIKPGPIPDGVIDGSVNPGYAGPEIGIKPVVEDQNKPEGDIIESGKDDGGAVVDGEIIPDSGTPIQEEVGVKPGYGGGSFGYGAGGVKPVIKDEGVVPDGGDAIKPGYGGGSFGYGQGGVKPDGGIVPVPDGYKPDEGVKPGGGGAIEPAYGGDIGGGNGDIKPDGPGIGPLGPEGCVCVPWYQCKDGEIISDGSGIIDPRKKPQPVNELPLEDDFKPPQCGKFHVCCGNPSPITEKPYEHFCGIRKPSGINKKILNAGRKGESEFGEWPWQGALMKVENKDIRLFQCGAVLIDKKHALTAAHCVNKFVIYDKIPLIVRFGEWDTQVTNEFLVHEDFKVERIVIHPGFKNNSLWNDIAVLTFDRDVQYAPHIDTICLPRPDDVFVGHECVVTGWGKDAYKGGSYSNILREVKVPIIDHYTCQDQLRKTRLGKYFRLHDAFTCAGGAEDEDACKGDGGGPLACYREDGTYSLAGLVSWGINCGQPNIPGVYVDVTKYLDWIKTVTSYAIEEYWPKA